jgi:hypothetical protein
VSRQGYEIAVQHGTKLLTFSSQEEAQQYFYNFRDKYLALLSKIIQQHSQFIPDYSPESLKQLEQWYFHLYESDSFQLIGTTLEVFEICMAMYFGETVVRNTSAHWIVEEYFLGAGKYELGVRKGSMTMMVNRFANHFREPNNKRRQSLFRRYKQYFSS